jgi:hypothetical protein
MTTVAMIGDSLLDQAFVPGTPPGLGEANVRAIMEAAGYARADTSFYACGGKAITANDTNGLGTVANIAAARAALGRVDQWLIALVTNNVGSGLQSDVAPMVAAMNTVLDAIGNEGRVTWVGLAFKGVANDNAALFNPYVQATIEGRGGRYADWQNYIHNGRDETNLWLASDSTHMSQAGYAIKNAWLRDQLALPWFGEWNGSTMTPLKPIEWNGSAASNLTMRQVF